MALIGRGSNSTMHRIVLIGLISLTVVVNTAGQEQAGYVSAEQVQRDVTFLLIDKDINEVMNRLESESASSASLLRRLVIYGRAGQTARVRNTLKQLASLENWKCAVGWDVEQLLRSADLSFDGQRFFYERICPGTANGAEEFVKLWQSNGDPKQLDAWLAERSTRNHEWLMLRVGLRAKTGTAGEVLDELAADVRAHPSDWARLDLYLGANERADKLQNAAWIADIFAVSTAGDYFKLAERVRNYSLQAGAKLLIKSLDIPFTEADAKLVDHLINHYRSAGPQIKVNWEKQLRYWTKRSLAETYQRMNQSLAAQPLMEELVAMKGDDILLQDVHQLAGQVQMGSGQRVIETKILRDGPARQATAEYWLERARYYGGRGETERERDSYRQALVALPVKREDADALNQRLEVVRSFVFFLARKHNREEDKPELQELLANELGSVPPETNYAFRIALLIIQNELDLADLRDSLLVKRPSFLARLLDGRREWGNDEAYLIKNILYEREIPSELKEKIWSSLASVVRDPGSTRAYHLAEALQYGQQWQRAIPLWRGYIEHARPTNWEGYKPAATASLFTAYCRTKQWQAAEKLLSAQPEVFWRELPKALGEVAIVAAQQNAIDDAMRLWRMSTNLDRRNLEALSQLAQTKAKPQLLAMYSKMKQEDPQSTIPDLALRLLQ